MVGVRGLGTVGVCEDEADLVAPHGPRRAAVEDVEELPLRLHEDARMAVPELREVLLLAAGEASFGDAAFLGEAAFFGDAAFLGVRAADTAMLGSSCPSSSNQASNDSSSCAPSSSAVGADFCRRRLRLAIGPSPPSSSLGDRKAVSVNNQAAMAHTRTGDRQLYVGPKCSLDGWMVDEDDG